MRPMAAVFRVGGGVRARVDIVLAEGAITFVTEDPTPADWPLFIERRGRARRWISGIAKRLQLLRRRGDEGHALLELNSGRAASVPLHAVVGASISPTAVGSEGQGRVIVVVMLCESPPAKAHDPTPPPRPHFRHIDLDGDLAACTSWVRSLQKALRADPARPRPRRIAVLVGRRSGSGRRNALRALRVLQRTASLLDACDVVEVSITGSVRATALRIARERRTAAWDALCIVGGDGLLSEAASGVLAAHADERDGGTEWMRTEGNAPLPLGIIPSGSTNAVALGLMSPAPTHTAAAFASALLLGSIRPLDAIVLSTPPTSGEAAQGGAAGSGAAEEAIALSLASVGFIADTAAMQDALKPRLGALAQNVAGALTCLRGPRAFSLRVTHETLANANSSNPTNAFQSLALVAASLETRARQAPVGLAGGGRAPGTVDLVMVRHPGA